MGHTFGLALTEGDLSIEAQLSIHLQYNHYPPVPQSMVQPCVEAIEAYWNDDTCALISLPEGVYWKGQSSAPAWAIAEGHHLDPWTSDYDYDAIDYR